MTLAKQILYLLSILLVVASQDVNYYIDPITGSPGNDGSLQNPFKDMISAFNQTYRSD